MKKTELVELGWVLHARWRVKLGLILCLVGFTLVLIAIARVQFLYVGLAMFAVGFVLMLEKRGVEVDHQNLRYRVVSVPLQLRKGTWRELEQVSKVVLRRERVHVSRRVGGMVTSSSNATYELFLVLVDETFFPVIEEPKYNVVREKGQKLAQGLGVPLQDEWLAHRKRQAKRNKDRPRR